MADKSFLLVAADILPDVFTRVLAAKQLLESGEAKNVSQAVRRVNVSRSAFYKYKDSVFKAEISHGIITLVATLRDEKGALQSLLAAVSNAGGNVVTINQSAPENGTAEVAVTVHTEGLHTGVDALCGLLKRQPAVLDIRQK